MGFAEELEKQAREEESRLTKVPPSTLQKLQQIEDELLQQSAEITFGILGFADIDPGMEEPPPEFFEKYGENAEKYFKLAKLGYVSKRHAPIGIETARYILVGITKARATSKGTPGQLNVVVQLPEPTIAEQPPETFLTEGIEVED